MDVNTEYSFNAPPSRVWDVLLDAEVIARCMPGCERLSPLGDDRYEAIMSVGLGSINTSFTAQITLADQVPPKSYTLIVEGQGGPGFVRGEAQISLEEQGSGTLVKVDGKAQVGGTISRVGQRLMGSVNQMMMDRFFTCLQREAAE